MSPLDHPLVFDRWIKGNVGVKIREGEFPDSLGFIDIMSPFSTALN